MKNYVMILAGGTGSRVGADTPKQFLLIKNKPVIAYTIMNFQKSELIESILIVCINGWLDYMKAIVEEYHLTKVKWIVEGGKTGYESTRNGLFYLKGKIAPNDFIILHDAARPIIPQKAISEMLRVALEKGNASLAIPCYETVLYSEDRLSAHRELNRDSIMRVQTPQAYQFGYLLSLYERAENEKNYGFVYANLVVLHYGGTIYFSKGFTNNIKITTKEDMILCEALMSFSEEDLYYF